MWVDYLVDSYPTLAIPAKLSTPILSFDTTANVTGTIRRRWGDNDNPPYLLVFNQPRRDITVLLQIKQPVSYVPERNPFDSSIPLIISIDPDHVMKRLAKHTTNKGFSTFLDANAWTPYFPESKPYDSSLPLIISIDPDHVMKRLARHTSNKGFSTFLDVNAWKTITADPANDALFGKWWYKSDGQSVADAK
ncbi:hypothetical protein DFS34DRAFT_294544 [Phlyctochytrium arcticum]|nr:hypothetical protein DFS34DRAFT_294544 [Phlyctochytrium arcticum]